MSWCITNLEIMKKSSRSMTMSQMPYTDVDINPHKRNRPRRCWVCDEVDERTTPTLRVVCWEDIDLWILQDPEENGGRDTLAMQILHRFHKGHNNKIEPTWSLFVEEECPGLCPISHILAKALAEKIIDNDGYQTSANMIKTKLCTCARIKQSLAYYFTTCHP